MATKKEMAPWIDDPRIKDWEKQDIWDMIVEEYPMMEHSPIFEEGYNNWDPYDEKNIKKHGRWSSLLDKSISRFQPGETLGGSAIDYLNTIKIEPEEDREEEDLMSLLAHEIPHLGMRLDTESKHLFNPLGILGIRGRVEKEENLNRMHDRIYQPQGYSAYQKAVPNLMHMAQPRGQYKREAGPRGYIEQTNIPGGLSYVGNRDDRGGIAPYGTQNTSSGNEFIRTSGLPKHHQRALGYVEPTKRASTPNPNQERHHSFNTGGIVSLVL